MMIISGQSMAPYKFFIPPTLLPVYSIYTHIMKKGGQIHGVMHNLAPKTQQIKFRAIFQHCLQLHLLDDYWNPLEISNYLPFSHHNAKTLGGSLTAGSQHRRSHPWQGHAEETWQARWIRTQGTPWTCSSIYPETKVCLSTVYYIILFTNSSDINRGLCPTTFLWRKST